MPQRTHAPTPAAQHRFAPPCSYCQRFPELKASTRAGIERLYGGSQYTGSRTVPHTLSHYLSFERLLIARIGPSIRRHNETLALVASGDTTQAELLAGLMVHVDEVNAYELARVGGRPEDARRYEVDTTVEGGELEARLGFSQIRAADMSSVRVIELQGEAKLRTLTADEFEALLLVQRAGNYTIGKTAMKASAALEAWRVFEDVPPLGVGEVADALRAVQPALAQASRSVIAFLQINGSFLSTFFIIPWPDELQELLAVYGAFNLDFFDVDVAGWLGSSLHYGSTTLGLCMAFLFLLLGIFASHRWLFAPYVRRRDGEWGESLEGRSVALAVLCCSLLYPVLAARILRLYHGIYFDELHMLESDLRLSMDDALPWQLAGVPFLFLIVVGVPSAFLTILCRVARPGAWRDMQPADKARLEQRYLKRYGQLYQMYQPQCWMWEMVEILRKLLLIALLRFVRSGTMLQLWLGILVSLISICLLTFFQPYVDSRVDAVAWVAQTATLCTLLGGAALVGAQGPDCECPQFLHTMGYVLPIINLLPLLMILYLIGATVHDVFRAYRPRRPPKNSPAVLRDEEPCLRDEFLRSPEEAQRNSHSRFRHSLLSPKAQARRATKWLGVNLGRDSSCGRDSEEEHNLHPQALGESEVKQAGLAVGSRISHNDLGPGRVVKLQGATRGHPMYSDGTPLKVVIAFDTGNRVRSFRQSSWTKLHLVAPPSIAQEDSRGSDLEAAAVPPLLPPIASSRSGRSSESPRSGRPSESEALPKVKLYTPRKERQSAHAASLERTPSASPANLERGASSAADAEARESRALRAGHDPPPGSREQRI